LQGSPYNSPLAAAAMDGNLEMVRLLIEAGADANRPSGPGSPLANARTGKQICGASCAKPYDQVIDLLTRSGAR
jgi:hypothetical protein